MTYRLRILLAIAEARAMGFANTEAALVAMLRRELAVGRVQT